MMSSSPNRCYGLQVMDSDASTASEPSPAGSPDALLALRLQLSETRLQANGLSLQKERLEVALAKTEAKLQMHDIGLVSCTLPTRLIMHVDAAVRLPHCSHRVSRFLQRL